MELSSRLKLLRKQAGDTQEALAEKINVSRQTVSNWENGKNFPDISSLVFMSELYGISLDELIKGDTDMMKKEHLIKTASLVTEMDRLDYTGSAVIHALFNGKYVKALMDELNAQYPDYNWKYGTLSQVYQEVSVEDNHIMIVLTRNTMAYERALKAQFPKALVEVASKYSDSGK